VLTNLGAFAAVIAFCNQIGSDAIEDYAGLSKRAPALAVVLTTCLLSLGGILPTAGFIGKLYLFSAAIEEKMLWLAVVGTINSVISLSLSLLPLENHPCPVHRSGDDGGAADHLACLGGGANGDGDGRAHRRCFPRPATADDPDRYAHLFRWLIALWRGRVPAPLPTMARTSSRSYTTLWKMSAGQQLGIWLAWFGSETGIRTWVWLATRSRR